MVGRMVRDKRHIQSDSKPVLNYRRTKRNAFFKPKSLDPIKYTEQLSSKTINDATYIREKRRAQQQLKDLQYQYRECVQHASTKCQHIFREINDLTKEIQTKFNRMQVIVNDLQPQPKVLEKDSSESTEEEVEKRKGNLDPKEIEKLNEERKHVDVLLSGFLSNKGLRPCSPEELKEVDAFTGLCPKKITTVHENDTHTIITKVVPKIIPAKEPIKIKETGLEPQRESKSFDTKTSERHQLFHERMKFQEKKKQFLADKNLRECSSEELDILNRTSSLCSLKSKTTYQNETSVVHVKVFPKKNPSTTRVNSNDLTDKIRQLYINPSGSIPAETKDQTKLNQERKQMKQRKEDFIKSKGLRECSSEELEGTGLSGGLCPPKTNHVHENDTHTVLVEVIPKIILSKDQKIIKEIQSQRESKKLDPLEEERHKIHLERKLYKEKKKEFLAKKDLRECSAEELDLLNRTSSLCSLKSKTTYENATNIVHVKVFPKLNQSTVPKHGSENLDELISQIFVKPTSNSQDSSKLNAERKLMKERTKLHLAEKGLRECSSEELDGTGLTAGLCAQKTKHVLQNETHTVIVEIVPKIIPAKDQKKIKETGFESHRDSKTFDTQEIERQKLFNDRKKFNAEKKQFLADKGLRECSSAELDVLNRPNSLCSLKSKSTYENDSTIVHIKKIPKQVMPSTVPKAAEEQEIVSQIFVSPNQKQKSFQNDQFLNQNGYRDQKTFRENSPFPHHIGYRHDMMYPQPHPQVHEDIQSIPLYERPREETHQYGMNLDPLYHENLREPSFLENNHLNIGPDKQDYVGNTFVVDSNINKDPPKIPAPAPQVPFEPQSFHPVIPPKNEETTKIEAKPLNSETQKIMGAAGPLFNLCQQLSEQPNQVNALKTQPSGIIVSNGGHFQAHPLSSVGQQSSMPLTGQSMKASAQVFVNPGGLCTVSAFL